MSRLDGLRVVVDTVLDNQEDAGWKREGYVHLYGVSLLCAQLAAKRGLNSELAAAAGMLHDIYSCRTGLIANHAHNGEEDARVILRDLELFTQDEQLLIRRAIFRHSTKATIHEPYDEVLKDADVLQRYLYDSTEAARPTAFERLQRVLEEIGLPKPNCPVIAEHDNEASSHSPFSRIALADQAEDLAHRHLVGDANKSGREVFPVIRYFPGATRQQGFDWCASFVYHCCLQIGLRLPIKYPGVTSRFAAVSAWLEWAKRPELGFFHAHDEDGYQPSRGDLVVFDRLVSEEEHDHIGVVLSFKDGKLLTAEGNVENRSGIFERDARCCINGYIRIADGYSYVPEAMEPVK